MIEVLRTGNTLLDEYNINKESEPEKIAEAVIAKYKAEVKIVCERVHDTFIKNAER